MSTCTHAQWAHICQATDVLSWCHGSTGPRTQVAEQELQEAALCLFVFLLLSALWRIGSVMVELTYILWEQHWRHRGISSEHTHTLAVCGKDWIINMYRQCWDSLTQFVLSLLNTHLYCKSVCVCSVTAASAPIQKQFAGLLHGAHTVLAGCRAWCNPSPP